MDGSIDPVGHPRAGAHSRLLVIPGFCFAITALAICLLLAFAATAAEVLEPILQNAQRIDRGSELAVDRWPRQRERSGVLPGFVPPACNQRGQREQGRSNRFKRKLVGPAKPMR
jgi:hypothetical protein